MNETFDFLIDFLGAIFSIIVIMEKSTEKL